MPTLNYALSKNFNYFFNRINPSPTFVQKASSEHTTITNLIEKSWLTRELNPRCFLQGSYRRQTSIYTINDIDIVVLCQDLYVSKRRGQASIYSQRWDRDRVFNAIASPLLNDGRYKDKVKYRKSSMCIKVDLGIKIEILPVVQKYPNSSYNIEPFCLYRPENKQWEDGYARYHQQHLTDKNRGTGNFIPAIKVFKHLRHYHQIKSVSFHIECLLLSLPGELFQGNSATYITNILHFIAKDSAKSWYDLKIITPCGERYLFTDNEWSWESWKNFHHHVQSWSCLAQEATRALSKELAIYYWQELLGKEYFPKEVS